MTDSSAESESWDEYRADLTRRTDVQSSAVRRVLEAVLKRFPQAPYPCAGIVEDIYSLTWAFYDETHITFSVEIDPDGTIEWFWRDRASDVTDGTEDDGVRELPERAIEYVGRFRPRE